LRCIASGSVSLLFVSSTSRFFFSSIFLALLVRFAVDPQEIPQAGR
jgi:hypothetical protein